MDASEHAGGTVMLVWFEGNVEQAVADLATDQDAFTVWLRAQLHDITGLDMSASDEGPPPELMLDWRA